jgi:hypothetical protein
MGKIKMFFLKLFGYRYIVNMGTKEIHRIDGNARCRTDMIRHGKYVTERRMRKMLKSGFNGCRYCLKKFDTG